MHRSMISSNISKQLESWVLGLGFGGANGLFQEFAMRAYIS